MTLKKLQKNKIYSNFKLISRKKYPQIESTINIFKHQRLGTELIFIENNDTKRAFTISFRTPSLSDEGMQHILEHSVLRGSRKYDFGNGETFAILLQNSMLSFLNALTYPDKTLYPFSTNVESEFFKVMDIYMDAALFPNIINNKNFFRQEGWRYDKDEKGNIFYNGVVFNEMKGVMSSVEKIREEEISKVIFKDTQESLSSGGDPNKIVNLSWEKLKKYHQEHYHPSNANIYIYGKLNIIKVLEKIENDFLAKEIEDENGKVVRGFRKFKKASKIKVQKKFSPVDKIVKFSSASTEKTSDFSVTFLGELLSKNEINEKLHFIISFLSQSENSLLKRNIVKSKLVSSFETVFELDYNQSYLNFSFTGINFKDRKKVEKIFYESIEEIIKKGINKKALKSYLSSFEYQFSVKNYKSEKGLDIIDNINRYKNYDFDFEHAFTPKKDIKILKDFVAKDRRDSSSVESILKKYIIKNKSKVAIALKATPDFNPYKALDKKLQKINGDKKGNSYSNVLKEIDDFKDYEKNLGPGKSKILPPKKSEIPKKPLKNKVKIKEVLDKKNNRKVKYFYSKIKEKNIKKVTLSFDALGVKETDLQYFQLLVSLLPHFSVKGKDKKELEVEKNNIFGSFSINNISGLNLKTNKIYSRFDINFGYLLRNEKKVFSFLNNLLENIDFQSEESEKTIIEKVDNMIKAMENSVARSGHSYAVKRAFAKIDEIGFLSEKQNGLEFLLFLKDFKSEIIGKKNIGSFIKKSQEIFKNILGAKDLQIAVAASENDFLIHKKININFTERVENNIYKKVLDCKNEAIIVDSLTNAFNVVAVSMKKNKIKFDAKYFLLSSFISYGYLWKKIREEGGAYGSGIQTSLFTKNMYIFSYMDSRINGTYDDYYKLSQYLKSKKLQDEMAGDSGLEKIRGMLASGLKDFLEPTFDIDKARSEMMDTLSGYDYSEKEKIIKEMLSFEVKDFVKIGKDFEKMFQKPIKITIGPKNKVKESIKKDKKLFDEVWELK